MSFGIELRYLMEKFFGPLNGKNGPKHLKTINSVEKMLGVGGKGHRNRLPDRKK